ncbi:cytochrome P450 [Kitasatospora sp. NPDC127111]|uniref:cytochrome P450 n=1 Tax=Kitasatospora sp. NPDC127111 TaxID=3345363 RepID=UPI003629DBE1
MTTHQAPVVAETLLRRLCDHLYARLDHSGRARSACGSRVLESVLAYRLLTSDGGYPAALDGVRCYLRAAAGREDLTPVDRTLLGIPGHQRDLLAGFDHHTADRKRLLMSTVLRAAGVPRAPAPPTPAGAASGRLHTWKRYGPDRWAPEAPQPPRQGFVPFGTGARKCIGEQFGLIEATLALATITGRWQLRPLPGAERVRPKLVATLIPGGLRLRATGRTPTTDTTPREGER